MVLKHFCIFFVHIPKNGILLHPECNFQNGWYRCSFYKYFTHIIEIGFFCICYEIFTTGGTWARFNVISHLYQSTFRNFLRIYPKMTFFYIYSASFITRETRSLFTTISYLYPKMEFFASVVQFSPRVVPKHF